MILADKNKLENLIVIELSSQYMLTAEDLLSTINQKSKTFTIQAIYKELRKLLKDGVIWKKGKNYGLSAAWVTNFSNLADNMHHTMMESPVNNKIIPSKGEKIAFTFSNLSRLDDFWINLIFVFLHNSERKQLYQWFPHPWFNLIHSHKSFPLHQALKSYGYSVKVIIGGDSFLDHRANNISTKGAYEYSYAKGPFTEQSNTYYACSDRYLLNVKIDDQKVKAIEDLYDSTKSIEEINIGSVIEMINQPCSIKVSIESETKKQRKIWKAMRTYFEI